MVDYRLAQGFGVEDIAIQMRADVDNIRVHVRGLRASGKLAKIFPRRSDGL
jgi:hypothetical protein